MGKLKKAFLIFVGFLMFSAVVSTLSDMFSPSNKLDIFVDCSSQPSGLLSSHAVGDALAVFPAMWDLNFQLSVSSRVPSDLTIKDATYIVYLGETQLTEGRFQSFRLPAHAHRVPLPDIQVTLLMDEITEGHSQLIANALSNVGNTTFTVSITFETPSLILGRLQIGSLRMTRDLEVSVQIVDSVSFSHVSWMSGDRYVGEVYPGDEILGRIHVSRCGYPMGDLRAEITEVSSDGSEAVFAIKDLKMDPSITEGTVDVSWRVPVSLSMDCIGFSIHLFYGEVEFWSAPTDPPPLPLVRRYSLSMALSEDAVEVSLSGTGYCAGDVIGFKVEANLEVSIDLEIEAGTVLVNTGSGQNMIIGETTVLRVEPHVEVELKIEAYCLDMYKDNPSSSEVFTIASGAGGYNEEAIKLMQSLPDVPWEHKSVRGVQLALWVVTEDPPRSELERRLTVTDSDLEDAVWLLQNIGVDPNQKKFFSTG